MAEYIFLLDSAEKLGETCAGIFKQSIGAMKRNNRVVVSVR
jgi:hypothetical protein